MRYILVFLFVLLPATAMAGSNGIQSLTAVSTLKASEANDAALEGANKQRDNIRQQKQLRDQQRSLERPAGSGMATGKRTHKPQLKQIASELDDIKRRLDAMHDMTAEDGQEIRTLQDRLSKMQSTLSNLQKKASDTAQGITQNLK